MDAKEFLNQYRVKKIQLSNIRERIEMCRGALTRCTSAITPSASSVRQPGNSSKVPGILAQIEEQETKAQDKELEILKTLAEIEEAIHKVPDANQEAVLWLRYIEHKTWEAISVQLHFSYRWTLRLHGRALQEIHRIISEP